ncbi:MAG TPA: type III-A CRISPR-associated protein Csm2, partial [Spirochaetales bacterium]|nr:type III-A CRISPR-associated protein Csm2 [Spirochaetales bacterium]
MQWAEAIKMVSKNQVRRIYDELKRLKRRVDQTNTKEDFDKIFPYILLEKSKIAYTIARAKKNINRKEAQKITSYDKLKAIFDKYLNPENIKDKDDYTVFCDFMEAIVGFHYEKAPER